MNNQIPQDIRMIKCVKCSGTFPAPDLSASLQQDGTFSVAVMRTVVAECPSCATPHVARVAGVRWNLHWIENEPHQEPRLIVPAMAIPKLS